MKHQARAIISSFLPHLVPAPLILGMALLQVAVLPLAAAPSGPKNELHAKVSSSDIAADPQALILSASGICEYSEDGTTFSRLKAFKEGAAVREESEGGSVKRLWGHSFKEGAVLRTGKNSRMDIFLRRTGTTVRLHPDSEIKIEQLARLVKGSAPTTQSVLFLANGKVVIAVRSQVAGTTLEVRNASGRAVLGGGGSKGRYIIAADGTQTVDKDSDVPLRLVRESGVTVIPPGSKSLSRGEEPLPAEPSEVESTLIDSDEMDALSTPPEKL